ncbi:NAD(+)/NADH kinase [Candidatus Desulfovibrio trichonymphae]|uniref:NAD kinase n=1 Tax=Candidatus Desulfovibrio trichonymphae TaxID=1725232 RepID=A0A1J1DYE8_9BACT|nr:NAD(+)/NADH kinase [Candidatus Desulfovibrio trichonymphae]BAV92126.1 NAD+ kinase [Candidatus Desulfovibrio trichonymphae]
MQNTSRRRVLLVCKTGHERAALLGFEILCWLRRRGHPAAMIDAGCDSPAYQANDLFFVIVLGGDGTMLGVVRRLAGRSVPLLGVNFGRVGFLTDVRPEHWQEPVAACLEGMAAVRSRMALRWSVASAGMTAASGTALNDVVLSRGALARLVCIDISIDGQHMGVLRGDGVILSTPVGSSGYCASAGGPLIHPAFEALILTPVCPFLSAFPPVVCRSSAVFSLRILHGSTECHITADGQEGRILQSDDLLTVTGLPDAVYLMGDEPSFLERLRTRGVITDDAGQGRRREKA